MSYGITVYQLEAGRRVDLAWFGDAVDAPTMEHVVTRVHGQFPAPGFEVVVAPL